MFLLVAVASLTVFAQDDGGTRPIPGGTIILQDARVIDGTGRPPLAHASIVIQNGKITRVSPGSKLPVISGARVIKLSGKTVIPGLISAHSHLGLVQDGKAGVDAYNEANISRQLEQYERYGVTTVTSLGMNRDLLYGIRSKQHEGKVPGATILTADRGIGVPSGFPPTNAAPDQVYRPNNSDDAKAAIREMAGRHPNLVKIWVDTGEDKYPRVSKDVEKAVIEESHAQHLRVAAHIFYLEDAKRLVEEGVDILAHSIRDKEVDGGLIARMKLRGVYYIPTLQLEDAFFIYSEQPPWMQTEFFSKAAGKVLNDMLISADYRVKTTSDPATARHKQYLKTAQKNVRRLAESGVRLGFGTDSGANPMRIPGFAEQRELWLLVQAGLTPLKAIQTATGTNARLLGIDKERGTIAINKQADLVILDGDPLATISNATRIAGVWHDGIEVEPLAKEPVPGISW